MAPLGSKRVRDHVVAAAQASGLPWHVVEREHTTHLAAQGMVTGASGRNWTGYGHDVALPAQFADTDQALLTDPQTSGGLLVACSPDTVDAVLATFKRHGFEQASVVGQIQEGPAGLVVAG